jgi:pilus assembly protein Flp/PilA
MRERQSRRDIQRGLGATMHSLGRCARIFLRDERGVTAIEYSLIAALVALVIIAAITSLGTSLKTTFNTVATSI